LLQSGSRFIYELFQIAFSWIEECDLEDNESLDYEADEIVTESKLARQHHFMLASNSIH
jgi:hypothetical protein